MMSTMISLYDAGSWQQMSQHLQLNMLAYSRRNASQRFAAERATHKLCAMFCSDITSSMDGKRLTVGVMDAPTVDLVDGRRVFAETHIIKLADLGSSFAAFADGSSFAIEDLSRELSALVRDLLARKADGRADAAHVFYTSPFALQAIEDDRQRRKQPWLIRLATIL
jgi:hypothetical protein